MDFYNERQIKKTRKDHKCLGCLEIIPAGTAAFYISCAYEGDFNAYYLCMPCREYLDRNPIERGDFWCGGDIGEARWQEGKYFSTSQRPPA